MASHTPVVADGTAGGGAPDPRRAPARMPVPPLLRDLAAWTWRLLLVGVGAYALLRVAERLYLVSLPVAAALLLSALLSPAVAFLHRHGVPRRLATALTVIAALLGMAGVMTWVVERAVAQAPALLTQLGDAVQRLPVSSRTLSSWRDQLVSQLEAHRATLTQGVLSGLATGAEVVTGLLLTLLLTIILLADGDRMWDWLVGRLSPAARPRVRQAGRHAYRRLSGWIRGTFLIALFHGVVVGLTLLLLGAPLVAPLAILVFFGSFIPIVGATLFGGCAVLVTFAAHGLTPAIVLTAVLVVDNQIEAHLLQPFLVGRYVRLHPFAVAVTITAGAMIAGFAGAFLAVPFTAAAYAALTHLDPPPPPRRRRRGPAVRAPRRG
jgi:putative heme transporter